MKLLHWTAINTKETFCFLYLLVWTVAKTKIDTFSEYFTPIPDPGKSLFFTQIYVYALTH